MERTLMRPVPEGKSEWYNARNRWRDRLQGSIALKDYAIGTPYLSSTSDHSRRWRLILC